MWLPWKKLFNSYLFPVALGQVCFVLIFTSTKIEIGYGTDCLNITAIIDYPESAEESIFVFCLI